MALQIFGAGMAGLLAANMLRRHRPTVLEAQKQLPDNHGALLRFRSDAVERATGIPLKRVQVQKAVYSNGRVRPVVTLADANAYSLKVTGEAMGRSILNLSPGERYIAPDTFLSELAGDIDIKTDCPIMGTDIVVRSPSSAPAISTMPMPALMKMVGWPDAHFKYRPIWSVAVNIGVPPIDLYQTIYYPYEEPFYRASFTGSQLILEYGSEPVKELLGREAGRALGHFGVLNSVNTISIGDLRARYQKYGKLLPISEDERKTFILAMTDRYNIYSVGRFATWRQILLDDVVKDVELAGRFISQRNAYARRSHWQQ